jgi:vitamin B12 transporter
MLRAPSAARSPASFAFRSLLAVVTLTSVDCALAQSSIPTPPEVEARMPRVVVIATREPLPLDRVTADVVVIDAQRIRESTADSLEDLLRREAGVQLSRNGGPGHAAGVITRGASTGSTLVLVDGVRIGSATLGLVSFEAISLAQIERIEVLRGPGSSLYGADAVGGVVRITTLRGAGAPRFSGHLAAGEYGSYEGDVSVAGSGAGNLGALDYAASFGHESSEGTSTLRPGDALGNYNRDHDGYRRRTAQLRLGYTAAPGHRVAFGVIDSRLTSKYDASEFAPPNFAQDATPSFRNRLDTQVLSLSYDGAVNSWWTTRLQLAHNEDDSLDGANRPDRFVTRRNQLTWQNAFAIDARQQLVAVLERLEEKAQSTGFGSDKRRDNDAVGVGYSGQFGAHRVSADVRYDDNSAYGNKTTGRLGWGYGFTPGWSVRALAGTTFRAPSFNDLFYIGYGVDTLRPEQGRSVEVGLHWQAVDSSAALTLYQNRVRDLIGFESRRAFCPAAAAYDFGCARNTNRARLQGATLTAAHRIGALSLRGTVDLLDATDQRTHQRLLRRAEHQETLSADYQIGSVTLGATLLSLGDRPDGGRNLGGYATLDLQARWQFAPHWQLEGKLLNVGDRDYEPARDYRSLGRQAWLGVRFSGIGW